ncbi:MAG: hypothetical protein ACRDNY_07325 [Gaiellaceae bacterium]
MWVLLAVDALAVLVVYSALDVRELYNVSREGIIGGTSRALVQLNFPIALVAIPLAILALGALPRRAWVAGAPAIALCALVPVTVDPGDLDARPRNALPALGVVLAVVLTVAAARRAGAGPAPRRAGDPLRVAVAVAVVLVSLPWLTAEAGFHLPGGVFLTDEPYAEPGEAPTAAVHLGHHHGFAGTLLVLSALLLSRPRLAGARLSHAYAALVSLLLAYGAANLVQDLWHEQVVKRGWTSADIPSVLLPGLSPMWALVLAGAALAYGLGFARRAEPVEPAIIL